MCQLKSTIITLTQPTGMNLSDPLVRLCPHPKTIKYSETKKEKAINKTVHTRFSKNTLPVLTNFILFKHHDSLIRILKKD